MASVPVPDSPSASTSRLFLETDRSATPHCHPAFDREPYIIVGIQLGRLSANIELPCVVRICYMLAYGYLDRLEPVQLMLEHVCWTTYRIHLGLRGHLPHDRPHLSLQCDNQAGHQSEPSSDPVHARCGFR